MTDFHDGDEVRVTYKGTVRGEPGQACQHLFVQTDDGESYSPSIKHVTLIDPAYEHDEWYRAANGATYLRDETTENTPWVAAFSGSRVSHHVPVRPLRKLVPESR